MAAGAFTVYAANIDDIRFNDLLAASIKCALVSSAYTPDASNSGNSLWSSVSANEIAAGNGYTAGGATLSGVAITAVTNGFKFSSNNVSWTASGGSIPAWRYAVFYVNGTLWGMTNPLIGYFIGDSTPADIGATASGNPLTLICPAAGWCPITRV